MRWIVVGLGNPSEEYKNTRHNSGRDMLRTYESKLPKNVKVLLPDTFMNDSGKAVKPLVKSIKAAEGLVVLHDDLDLPLGKVKISFGSGAGGHNGVKSIQQAIKTKDFTRIRIGISPATAGGKLKKPGSSEVIDFVLGKFKPSEQDKFKKATKDVRDAIDLIVEEGVSAAMNEINSR